MGMETEQRNAGWQLDKIVKQAPDPALELVRSAHALENMAVSNIHRFMRQLDEAEERSKRRIHEHLSELVALSNYPPARTGFTLTTGEGPATITIQVSYSGISSWFLGLWKSKEITLSVSLDYGLKMDEMERSFSVQDKRGNAREIATFLKSVSERIYQISRELNEKNPQYADLSDFESELVLKVSEVLADPSICAIYTNLDEIGAYRKKYEKELQKIGQNARAQAEQVVKSSQELKSKINEAWKTYAQELADFSAELKTQMTKLVEQKKQAIQQEADKEREVSLKKVLQEVEAEKRKVEKKIAAMERELDKLRKRKGNVTQTTRELLVKLDRWFPDYDFGRNRKLDNEDVTPQLRAESARKVGRLVAKDPDIYASYAVTVFEFMVRNIRRSAGEKFNGLDVRAITNEVCWLLSSLEYNDLKWVMDRLGRSYNKRTTEEIHSLAESLVIQKEGESQHA